MPALDGLRAVAITLVVAFHAFRVPAGGWLGVDLFFVLSGFLITTLLVQEHREHGRVSLRAFYERRARRLFPALFVMLAIVGAIFGVQHRSLLGVVPGLFYFTNVVMAVDSPSIPEELRHLWSLAAEEQFYLLWPVVLFVIFGGRLRLGMAAVVAGAAFATGLAMVLYGDGQWDRIAFGPDTRGASILVGCGLALMPWRRLRALEFPAIALVIGLLAVNLDPWTISGPPVLLFALACAVLIARCLEPGPLATLLAFAPIVFLGRISYSLYLWHVPILIWVGAEQTETSAASVMGVALALIAATASYYLIELPFLRRKPHHGSRVAEPLGLTPSATDLKPTAPVAA